ncbi:MAG: hypothetical protein C4324_01910 [Blastocatellia bacterium]
MRLLYAILTALFVLEFHAQSSAQVTVEDEIRIDTELIEVPVSVFDKAGRPVAGLKASDFTVFEDGVQQKIISFSMISEPIEVALILDSSGSTKSTLPLIQKAAEGFITMLRPEDRAAIIGFRPSRRPGEENAVGEILSGLSTDKTALISSLQRLETSFGTPFYDSILLAVNRVFADSAKPEFLGRRAIVMLTDGVDSVSESDFAAVRNAVQKAGVSLFFVRLDTRDFFESGLLGDCSVATHFSQRQLSRYYSTLESQRAERVTDFCRLGDFERLAISKRLYEIADNEMLTLSNESGGRVFKADDLTAARTALMEAAREAGLKYSLGYYSNSTRRNGAYRKITVRVRSLPAGASIRARDGYFAPSEKRN